MVSPWLAVNFIVGEFGGTAVVSTRFCGQLFCGRVWWLRSSIPAALRSTSLWPSLVAPQWYPHGFAINFIVAEFGGAAVVPPRFCGQLLCGRVLAPQWYPCGFAVNFIVAEFGGSAVVCPRFGSHLLRCRVWWRRSGILAVLRSTSAWPSLVARHGFGSVSLWPSLVPPRWYPPGRAVNFIVAEFGGTAVVSPRFAVNFFVGEFGGFAVVPPQFLRSISVWPNWATPQWYPMALRSSSSWASLVARQWYPHGFAVNFFVAEFGGTAVVSPRFCGQFLRGRVWWHRSGIPAALRSTSSWPSLVALQW